MGFSRQLLKVNAIRSKIAKALQKVVVMKLIAFPLNSQDPQVRTLWLNGTLELKPGVRLLEKLYPVVQLSFVRILGLLHGEIHAPARAILH